MTPPTVQMVHCVVCDDVRTEIFRKETIVGVYNPGIVVPTMPWVLMLCLWMTVIWKGDGEIPIEIRILNPHDVQVASQNGTGHAIVQGFESTITFRNIFFTVEIEGSYRFQWKAGYGDWETIREMPISVLREQSETAA